MMPVCVIIPTYNNHKTLPQVLDQTIAQGLPVIVVDDGSTDPTAVILKQRSDITVVSYQPNRGKGYALQCGFRKALGMGFSYAITLDSDGQHNPADIPCFLDELQQSGNCMIIGTRNMNQDGIPMKSNFGRRFSNFWFWVETGIRNNDTQSGFRLYPLKAIEKKRFYTTRFEFEIESLVRLAWDNIPVKSVPVGVTYHTGNEHVSHFRPFRDFFRISVLNSVLVMLACLFFLPRLFFLRIRQKPWKEILLNPNESNLRKSSSIGFGVFMGIVPVWGFQMLIAFALAIPLRLNKTLVLISSNISVPPMIPLIIFLSLLVGSIVLDTGMIIPYNSDISVESLGGMFLQYVVGSCVFAAIAGMSFFLLSYSLLRIFRKNR